MTRTKTHGRSGCGGRGNWSGFNIAAVVLGMVFFWPLGLVMLFWVISGRDLRELPGAARDQWQKMMPGESPLAASTDNVVFNEYQQTQFDRINDIKAEIADRARRFRVFREDARRRKDEEEFHRFMASAPVADDRG